MSASRLSQSGVRWSVPAVALLLMGACAGCHGSSVKVGGSTGSEPPLCKAPLVKAWRKALDEGIVPLSRRASVVPWALADDGSTFFASLYSRRYSGVVRIDAASSRFTAIKRFANARDDQADGSFDGRWLVWNEYHSLSGFDDFTTWSWDSRNRRLRQIGAAERAPAGGFWPSPWRQPDVRDGFATWTQGSGSGGVGKVHVFDLAHGIDKVVRRGHPAGSFLVGGGLAIWPESMRPGAPTVMQAADVATGRRIAAPKAFQTLRGVSALVTDGAALAYPNSDYTSLWWSPSPTTAARRVFTTGNAASHIDNSVQVAGPYVSFGVPPASYLANLVKGRYIRLSAGGYTRLDARSLVLVKPSKRKAIHPISDVVFLPLPLPPLPACR